MDVQITSYVDASTKKWLRAYALKCGLKASEVVKLLVVRERKGKWLASTKKQRDVAESAPTTRRRSTRHSGVRPQAVGYVDPRDREWLDRYAKKLSLNRSDAVRLLLERERRVKWLLWSLAVPDTDRGAPKKLG